MKILVVGDSYCPSSAFRTAFAQIGHQHDIAFVDLANEPEWHPQTPSELGITEYFGSPRALMSLLSDQDALVVHGAPVTDAVLDASPNLKLVCCARGGPVNVDLAAATARGIAVSTTPGKNANAVAELTLAFMIMLARRVPQAMRFVDAGGEFGKDNFEGAQWFGLELAGRTVGVIGCGRVGGRVAQLATAIGMRAVAYDPYVPAAAIREVGATPVSLEQLFEQADIVSLHVRTTPANRRMIGRDAFAQMKAGVFFINTARDVLVDEDALYQALASGRVGGAAVDVLSPQERGQRHRLLNFPNVVVVAHIGGATIETLENGGTMAAAEIERFSRGDALAYTANGNALKIHTGGRLT